MDSVRQQKVARQIHKELGELLQREGKGYWGQKVLVTVTRVTITPDLQIARVHLSIFGVTDKQEIVDRAKEHGHDIRFQLGKAMRHQLRVIPQLEFFEDDSLDYIDHIDTLLNH